MADDKELVVASRLWNVNGPHGMAQKPFFFNHFVHAVCHARAQIETIRFQVNVHGSVHNYSWLKSAATSVFDCWGSIATCVYRGRAYLFFDSAKKEDRWRFHIRYKTTVNPETGWLPADENGLATGLSGSYVNWSSTYPPCVNATVMNDKIYLFYHRDESIYYATYDGTSWKEQGAVRTHCTPIFVVCTAASSGNPYILFGGRPISDGQAMHLTLLRPDGRIEHLPHPLPLNYVTNDNMFGMGYGSIVGGMPGNVIQIFGNNRGSRNDLRRISIHADSLQWEADWTDTTIDSIGVNQYRFCDVAEVPVVVDTAGNIRQFLAVLTHTSLPKSSVSHVSTYLSDYFRCEHVSSVIDTARPETKQPTAWTLLGVIEGVPPFSRNGVSSDKETSAVIYGSTETKSVQASQSFEISIMMAAGGGMKDVWNVSAELAHTIGSVDKSWQKVEKRLYHTLANTGDNLDGVDGWLVVLKPRLVGRVYSRLSHDGMYRSATLYVVQIVGATVTFDGYKLEQPPAGMQARRRSSDYDYWYTLDVPSVHPVVVYDMPALEASIGGERAKAELIVSGGSTLTRTGSWRATLKGSVLLKSMFKVEQEDKFTFASATEVTTEFSQSIVATLELPGRSPANLEEIVDQPYWLVPPEGMRLDPAQKPFWVPNDHVSNGTVPWCLTWVVIGQGQARR